MQDLTTEFATRLFSLPAPAASPLAARDEGPPFTAALADANRSRDLARTGNHESPAQLQASSDVRDSTAGDDSQETSQIEIKLGKATDSGATPAAGESGSFQGGDSEQKQHPDAVNPDADAYAEPANPTSAEAAILAAAQPLIVAASQAQRLSEQEIAETDGLGEGQPAGIAGARLNALFGKKSGGSSKQPTLAIPSAASAAESAADPNAEPSARNEPVPAVKELQTEFSDEGIRLPKLKIQPERKAGEKTNRSTSQAVLNPEQLPAVESSNEPTAKVEPGVELTAATAALTKAKSRGEASRATAAKDHGEAEPTDGNLLSGTLSLSPVAEQNAASVTATAAAEISAPAVSPAEQSVINSPGHSANPPLPHDSRDQAANNVAAARGDSPRAFHGVERDSALSEIDRVRFVQRVARAFQNVKEGEGEVRLRLSPPELGALRLEVTLRDGALTARLEAETATARNLLMENLPQLKERLAEQNVRIESFEVEVRDQPRGDTARQFAEHAKDQAAQARNRVHPATEATARGTTATITRSVGLKGNSAQLNVII